MILSTPLINSYNTAAPTSPATATAIENLMSLFIFNRAAAPVDTGPVLVLVEAVSELETDAGAEDTDVAELTPDKLCAGIVKPKVSVAVAETVAVVGTVSGVAVIDTAGTDVNKPCLVDDPVCDAIAQVSAPVPVVATSSKYDGEYVAVPEYNGHPGTSVFGRAVPPPQSRNWHSSPVPGTYQIILAPEMLLVQPERSVRARVVVVRRRDIRVRVIDLIISFLGREYDRHGEAGVNECKGQRATNAIL